MRDVALEELPVAGDALVEVLRRGALALVGLRRRAVAPGIHHHAQLVADIEPDLRLIRRQPEDVHVLGFQVAHIGLRECARLADLRRDGAPGRVDRDAAQEHRPAIQMELPVPNLEGPEPNAHRLGRHGLAVLGRRDLKVVEHGRVRAPQLGLQAGNGLGERRPFGRARSGLPQRTLPEELPVAGWRDGCLELHPAKVLPCLGRDLDPHAVGRCKRQNLLEFERGQGMRADQPVVMITSGSGSPTCLRNLGSLMLLLRGILWNSRSFYRYSCRPRQSGQLHTDEVVAIPPQPIPFHPCAGMASGHAIEDGESCSPRFSCRRR